MKLEKAIKNNYVKLNIGCGLGAKIIPDYVNLDIVDDPRIDVVCNVLEMKVPDSVVDEAISEHLIEHLKFKDIPVFLREVKRVLKPGAKFYLSCPNLPVVVERFLNDKDNRWTTWGFHIFGGQLYDTDVHMSGFDKDSLKQYFVDTGFKNIIVKEIGEYGRGLAVWCEK